MSTPQPGFSICAWNKRLFIPGEHTPEGWVSTGTDSFVLSGSVPSCPGPSYSRFLSRTSQQHHAGLPLSKSGLVRRPEEPRPSQRDAWPLTGSQPSTETCSGAYSSCPGKDKPLQVRLIEDKAWPASANPEPLFPTSPALCPAIANAR